MVPGDLQARSEELLGRLDEGGGEAGDDVELEVAVKEPDAWISCQLVRD